MEHSADMHDTCYRSHAINAYPLGPDGKAVGHLRAQEGELQGGAEEDWGGEMAGRSHWPPH